MTFKSGRVYKAERLSDSSPLWKEIQNVVSRRTKAGMPELQLQEVWDVKWREKPFPWSYYREFKPKRRWFYHGTYSHIIQNILDQGFIITSSASSLHGRMLKDGIYATYHTNKGKLYAFDEYIISVMIYAPHCLVVERGQSIDEYDIIKASKEYHAIEVRTGSIIQYPQRTHTMANHEICVYDSRRIIPRFILKII